MNWLEFLASVIAAVAWPSVVLVIFLFLRHPAKSLLPFLQRLKYKEFELEFNRRVEEMSAEVVHELPAPPPGTPGVQEELVAVAKLAEISPRAAVLESWLEVETAAADAARRLGWQAPSEKASSGSFAIKFLEKQPALDQSIVGLLRELRALRNQAAHIPDFALTKASAIEYGSNAAKIAKYFRNVG